MKPYYSESGIDIFSGDNREVLPILASESVDSIVTDPPYELGFMGKGWDRSGIAYDVAVWSECLRVLKPGGYLLAFGGSRTYHRLACAIEDAGFEIRDQIQWIYGSGFPKSLDVSKAIDAAAGVEREIVGADPNWRQVAHTESVYSGGLERPANLTAPASDAAKQWDGWGTALKPAHEPIVLARKPLVGTVAENVLRHGTGGLNVDGCRIETDESWEGRELPDALDGATWGGKLNSSSSSSHVLGRFPANVIHDGSDELLAEFEKYGERISGSLAGQPRTEDKIYGSAANTLGTPRYYEGNSGSAARFFYCAKASQDDRGEGLECLPVRSAGDVTDRKDGSDGLNSPRAGAGRTNGSRNHHPTVKPTSLMRYLVRLITPPDGTCLDPFLGSGSTGKATALEGFNFIGIELSADYCELAKRRIMAVTKQGKLVFA